MPNGIFRAAHVWRWLPPLLLLAVVAAGGCLLVQHGVNGFDSAGLLRFRDAHDTTRLAGPAWIGGLWFGLSRAGDAVPRIIVAVLTLLGLVAYRRWRSAVFLALMLLGGNALSALLKQSVGRARPQVVAHLVDVHSQSFPSGHALDSTVFYVGVALLLAACLRRRHVRWLLYGAAGVLALATGVSRVALGVHYPTDVIAGWILGGAWLWLCFGVATQWWPRALPGKSVRRVAPTQA